jgi:predicted AlkP superfamily phosphohydrolase/phosphomutase
MPKEPLIIFALDSGDFSLLEKWGGQGLLPNLTALGREGATLEVTGPGVFDEIGAWITAFSGVPQERHGYYGSRRLKANSYELEVVAFEEAGVRPFWAGKDGGDVRVAILDPPEPTLHPGVNGIELAGLNMHYEAYADFGSRSVPSDLARRVEEMMGGNPAYKYSVFDAEPGYYVKQLEGNLDRMRRRCEAFRQLLREDRYDLIVIGFGEVHDLGHMMWPFDAETATSPSPDAELRHGLRRVHEKVDEEIGRFLEMLPPGAEVMVLSLYGLKDQLPTAPLGEQLLDRLGYRVASKSQPKPFHPLSIARRVLPQPLREKLSKFVPFDGQQRLLHSYFASATDFSRSRVFTIPSIYQNWIRVNVKGRDPLGMVEARDCARLLDEIEQEMRKIVDPVTGQAAISVALRTSGEDGMPTASAHLPDMVVHWRSAKHFLERAEHPSGELRQSKPQFYRNSFHRFPGFLIWKGKASGAARGRSIGVLDIAPTCADLLGVPRGAEMAGRSLVALSRG